MIALTDLAYRYPGERDPVLDSLGLTLAAGDRLLVAGSTGSGKSTLLRTLNGLVPHFHGGTIGGRLRVAERDPVARGPRGMSAAVGFVFQDPETQMVAQRVEDEVAFALENHGLSAAAIEGRVTDTLDRLGAGALRRRRLDTLSGGERQRVAIAAALALRPPLLVLDEPTSQLDPAGARALVELLDRLHRRDGLTLVVAEHRVERVAPLVDRACLLTGDGSARVGAPEGVLAGSDLAPPLARLGHALGWDDPPWTVENARRRLASRPGPPPGPTDPPPPSTAAGERVLVARGLRYRYPGADRLTLDGIDLALHSGEVTALIGANGSGKSTLFKLLIGLLAPERGEIELLGRPLAGRPVHEIARQVGLVPQHAGRLLFADTVAEEVRFTRRAQCSRGTGEGPGPLLERLGIAHLAAFDPKDLSGGERQRAALAAILAGAPRVLLLDEPTRGLDTCAKRRLAGLLLELAADGVAVAVATHDAELVAECAGRCLRLDAGRVLDRGTPVEVLPRSDYASALARLLPGPPAALTVADALRRLEPASRPETGDAH